MQHVKFNEIPPLKGPDSQGLNVSENSKYIFISSSFNTF